REAREQFRHARLVRLGTEHADIAMFARLPQQVLAGAEARFQPDLVDGSREVRLGIGVLAKSKRQCGEKFFTQALLPRGGFRALATPVEKFFPAFRRRRHATARFRLSARSVFSQEKPPSESDARPKCP